MPPKTLNIIESVDRQIADVFGIGPYGQPGWMEGIER